MIAVQGIAVSPGIAMGKALVLHSEDMSVPRMNISEDQIPREIARFEDGLTKTRADLLGIRRKISQELGREHSDIFNAHLLILEDRTLIEDVIARIKEDRVNTEYAFSSVIQKYFQAFSRIDDEYLKERVADIKDIGRRILQNLMGHSKDVLSDLKEQVVIVSHDLSPSDTATMNREQVIGFATDIGGPTSHTAIMARSLEIPAVVGIEGISKDVATGDYLILDGTHGVVVVNPDRETIERYRLEERKYVELNRELTKLKDLKAETLDHHPVELSANIEFPDEIPSVIAHGAEGIGLYRTEYFYLNRSDLPTEEEQYQAYKKVAEQMSEQPVVVRTLDLGGDKFLSSIELPYEMNPFLGWRAIRFCLARVDIFKNQLRAILRASSHGKLKIMYPMISNLEELLNANQILEEARQELRKEGIPFDENLEVGAMIEIPSAALISHILAKEVDFFSIGTNDLIQYALAVDRVNEKIAYLYDPSHPAILQLIKMVIDNGHANNIWVGTCGEMCGDPVLAILLVGMGIDEMSTSPLVLPKVKKAIRSITLRQAREISEEAMKFSTGGNIKKFVAERLREIMPELIEHL
ncbi:MAG: phosphoenolpyruvate--protein phosphotransferase [Candidatus Omnitrophica bacterium]|nr:phosphoenolpyruvate--protein phosphotransferase [Candidatus Omnitrophota bacterium]